jgi:hypothetical protein
MTAARYDFTIEQGATFTEELRWLDDDGAVIDTSGYTARLQARDTVDSDTTLIDLTDANGGIVVGIVGTGADQYNIKLTMTSTATAALTWPTGKVKIPYDLEMSGGGIVTRVLKGHITLDREITR